ncbi:MAG TPA: hypothetical protein VEB68_08615 [Croceibacterium sp.]|nr:hypothetical protein [Croceibacterium sp.]
MAAIAIALAGGGAAAQSLRVGDQVEASPLMMNSRWEPCTVTAVHPSGDVAVACGPRRTEYVVQARWVRAAAATGEAVAQPAAEPPPQSRPGEQAAGGLCPDAPRGRVGHRQQENGVCRMGAAVVDRQGRQGTVIDAPDEASCRVCLTDGTHRDYLTWMLGTGAAQADAESRAGAVPSGAYHCAGGAAGNMDITVTGGRWDAYYAETLPDGRVGISSQPNGRPYYMICERR